MDYRRAIRGWHSASHTVLFCCATRHHFFAKSCGGLFEIGSEKIRGSAICPALIDQSLPCICPADYKIKVLKHLDITSECDLPPVGVGLKVDHPDA